MSGIAAAVAGLGPSAQAWRFAVTAGGADPLVPALVIAGASLLWFAAGGVFLTVEEEPSSAEESDPAATIRGSLALLRDDVAFRKFVVARSEPVATGTWGSLGTGWFSSALPFSRRWQVTDRRYLGEESMALIHSMSQDHADKEVNQHQLPAAG